MNKFDNVGNDPDTKIIISTPAKFDEFDVLYQKWSFDGITGESLIFSNDDIKHLTTPYLMEQVRNSPLIKDCSSEITTSSKNEFTFFNFNFTTND